MKNLQVVFENFDFEFNPHDQTLEHYSSDANDFTYFTRQKIIMKEMIAIKNIIKGTSYM